MKPSSKFFVQFKFIKGKMRPNVKVYRQGPFCLFECLKILRVPTLVMWLIWSVVDNKCIWQSVSIGIS